MFLAAERGIPHNPEQHAAYVDSWIQALQQDKHEIFRAAHDASAITDYLLSLERERSVDAERSAPAPSQIAAIVRAEIPNDEHGRSVPESQRDDIAESVKAAESLAVKTLGGTARLLPAQIQGGIYRGPIVGETAYHVIQRQSVHSCIAHLKELLDPQPEVGKLVSIQYAHARGTVREVRAHAKTAELSR